MGPRDEITQYLKRWAQNHITNPYPDEDDRLEITEATGMNKDQILHWFKNFRSRLWDKSMKVRFSKSPLPSPSTSPRRTSRNGNGNSNHDSGKKKDNAGNNAGRSGSNERSSDRSSSSEAPSLSVTKKSPPRSLFSNNDTQPENGAQRKTSTIASSNNKKKRSRADVDGDDSCMDEMDDVSAAVAALSNIKRGLATVNSSDDPESPPRKKNNSTVDITPVVKPMTKKATAKGTMTKKTKKSDNVPKSSKSSSSSKATAESTESRKGKTIATKNRAIPGSSSHEMHEVKEDKTLETGSTLKTATKDPETKDNNIDSSADIVHTPNKSTSPKASQNCEGSTGRWTEEEHNAFLKGLEVYGKKWPEIASLVKSRTPTQCRTHAQKHFLKLSQDQDTRPSSTNSSKKTDNKKPLDVKRPIKSERARQTRVAKSNTGTIKKKKPNYEHVPSVPPPSENKIVPASGNNSCDKSEEEDDDACCLCHCGVDCSDRALFFPKERKQELEDTDDDYFYNIDDPYLPESCYDRNNALVFCDTCNRMYHQKCHFVPLLVLPRGQWNCLICSMKISGDIRPKKIQGRSKSTKTKTSESTESRQKFFTRNSVTDQIFQSLPPSNHDDGKPARKELEKEWEFVSGPFKAQLWEKQLKAVRNYLRAQASNMRLADSALVTLTTTRRNRQHFASKNAKSQELFQTLVSLSRAKLNIRHTLLSLETLRTRDEPVDFSVLLPWCEKNPKFLANIFPHGTDLWKLDRRIIPRTQERQLGKAAKSSESHKNGIPGEIDVSDNKSTNITSSKSHSGKAQSNKTKCSTKNKCAKISEERDIQDDSSGVSLTNLQCCICKAGDASDDNDLILCDGEDCHRAFHMNCIHPAVSASEVENEDEDWFCPLCSGISNLIHEMHALCVGEAGHGDDHDDNDNMSMESWEHAKDIFPEAEWEFETSSRLLKGRRNDDTQRLLANYLGDEFEAKSKNQTSIGSDSEDENDYSLFDEESFQERRRREYEDEGSDGDETSHSSQATLGEMSIVELKVDKSELAALSDNDGEENDSDDEDDQSDGSNEDKGTIRRSRRLRKKAKPIDDDSDGVDVDNFVGADFSESNIIEGKRKRKRVDYRKLNDVLFGDLSSAQQGELDDGEDFRADSSPKRRKASKKRRDRQRKQNDHPSDGLHSDSNDDKEAEEGSKTSSGSDGNDDNDSIGDINDVEDDEDED